MEILSVVGARPQFIKASAISNQIRKPHNEVIVHTGQHYDEKLSDIFFENLDIPLPDYNLAVGSHSHATQTAKMILGLEEVIEEVSPDIILLYGDTNSTLAGAITGSKIDPLVVHVEAGLRSYNQDMPEEINRILTDHSSDILCAPSERARTNLKKEGLYSHVYTTGDVMYDALLNMKGIINQRPEILDEHKLANEEYILSTVHRESNTNDKTRLESIFLALAETPQQVLLPLHPRTENYLKDYGLWEFANESLYLIDPVEYSTFLQIMFNADRVATDSGSIQKEAFFLDTYCVTMRDETEWVETVEAGWNTLVGADHDDILTALQNDWERPSTKPTPYGEGNASEQIYEIIKNI